MLNINNFYLFNDSFPLQNFWHWVLEKTSEPTKKVLFWNLFSPDSLKPLPPPKKITLNVLAARPWNFKFLGFRDHVVYKKKQRGLFCWNILLAMKNVKRMLIFGINVLKNKSKSKNQKFVFKQWRMRNWSAHAQLNIISKCKKIALILCMVLNFFLNFFYLIFWSKCTVS